MTGFGAATAVEGSERIGVEIRSVNHKFCEVKARLPRELASLEPALLQQIRRRLGRGAIEISVHRGGGRTTAVPKIDVELAREYAQAQRALGEALGLSGPLSLQSLFEAEGVVRLEDRPAELPDAARALERAAGEALSVLEAMRCCEGAALARDVEGRIARLETLTAEAGRLAPKALEEYRDRFAARAVELARGAAIAPDRLAQEVALIAERMDVEEELSRLGSHLAQLRGLLSSTDAVGRRMDFLIQEIHREVNTFGNKSQSAALVSIVVELKAEAERIREQVQNVE